MAINFVPLDKSKHKDLKVNLQHNFEHAANAHLSAATLREYGQLASCIPIVFIKDEQSGKYFSVAMLGLEQNKNFFLHDNKWQGHVVPLNMVRYPFDVRPGQDNQLGVMIDENSPLLGDEGEPIFTEAGEPSEYLQSRQQLLGELANSEIATQKFIDKLVELELLQEMSMLVEYKDGSRRNMTGVNTVDEKKIGELTDEQVLELHKAGHLGAIYTSLVSLGQLHRLITLSNNLENPIINLQMRSTAEIEAEQQAAQSTSQA